jgi:hypothetical protein
MRKRKHISEQIIVASVRSLLKESDKGCVILVSAILEDTLEEIHEAYVTANLTGTKSPNNFFRKALTGLYGPLSNFAGKINIAYAYGLISHEEYDGLEIIRRLRNEAAHCIFEFNFQDAGVRALINELVAYERIKQAAFLLEQFCAFSEIDESKRRFVVSSLALRLVLSERIVNGLECILAKREKLRKK